MQKYALVIETEKGQLRSLELNDGTFLIGRGDPEFGSSPDLDLEDLDRDAKVSRRHAFIECHGNKVVIEDAGSLNGTFVNRTVKLDKGQRHQLAVGDEVLIGKIVIKLVERS